MSDFNQAKREKPNCKGCFFSELSDPDPTSLQRTLLCKHSPPQIFTVLQQTSEGIMSIPATGFPGVQEDSWCHQFKPKTPMAIVN